MLPFARRGFSHRNLVFQARRFSKEDKPNSYILPDKVKASQKNVRFETDIRSVAVPQSDAILQTGRGRTSYIMPKPPPFPSRVQLWQYAVASAVPMIGFGFMDNLIMIQAGDLIDNTICAAFGFGTLTAAALGQIVSDVSGVSFGGVVEATANRLGLPHPGLTPDQEKLQPVRLLGTLSAAIGVIVGCCLGMLSLLTLDLHKKQRAKLQMELQALFDTMMQEGAETMSSQHCALWILDEEDGEPFLWSKAHEGTLSTDEELEVSWAALVEQSGDSNQDTTLATVPVHSVEMALHKLGYQVSQTELTDLLALVGMENGQLDIAQYRQLTNEVMSREDRKMEIDSSSILSRVINRKKLINISNSDKESNWSAEWQKEHEQYFGYQMRSMLAGPILSKDGKLLGAIEFANKIGPKDEADDPEATLSFSEDDERVLRLLCAHAGAFIEQCDE